MLNCEANAMNASAAIFETLVEVNSKFAKIADKEYDSLSAEVKRWFKKLAVSAVHLFNHCPSSLNDNRKKRKLMTNGC